MKKLSLLLTAVCLLFALAACSSNTAGSKNDDITSLVMHEKDAQELTVGKTFKAYVEVEPSKFDASQVEFVIMHPELASVEKGTDTSGAVWFTVTAKAPGKTGVYAQTPDGTIKSETIAITITE